MQTEKYYTSMVFTSHCHIGKLYNKYHKGSLFVYILKLLLVFYN